MSIGDVDCAPQSAISTGALDQRFQAVMDRVPSMPGGYPGDAPGRPAPPYSNTIDGISRDVSALAAETWSQTRVAISR